MNDTVRVLLADDLKVVRKAVGRLLSAATFLDKSMPVATIAIAIRLAAHEERTR